MLEGDAQATPIRTMSFFLSPMNGALTVIPLPCFVPRRIASFMAS
jgi:hypothetical protein